jgi:NADH-quinone oxidoreductase subunit I
MKLSFIDNIYIPAVVKGLWITFRHLVSPHKFTLQYPEERLPIPKGYRGEPRLKVEQEGNLKCVACFLCQTACPSRCIHIVASNAPPGYKQEKYPAVFNIDMLRCISCGYCEEACPCDAIYMAPIYSTVATTRASKIYDKNRLTKVP